MQRHPGAHLILGGARSGKTAYAMSLAIGSGLEKWMVVTAAADDPEMVDRIARHRAERGAQWRVIEEHIDILDVIQNEARPERVLVVDCLTLWLSNLSFRQFDLSLETTNLATAAARFPGPVILVSNEIGLGLVPDTGLGRSFRDAQGRLNQALAQTCKKVTFVVAGLPLALKS
jgi:adenosylcobinamide kinase/adenosylcobinamide-phosphate guanylyltransferase